MEISFNEYNIELVDEFEYDQDSSDNVFRYNSIYQDDESDLYKTSRHGIKILRNQQLKESALVSSGGGRTGIHSNSALIFGKNLLICCAYSVFSLSLPSLELNWVKKMDDATCFGIYQNRKGVFVHGELSVSQISPNGETIWTESFADITVTHDGRDSFKMLESHIEVVDWQNNFYKLSFDGEFI